MRKTLLSISLVLILPALAFAQSSGGPYVLHKDVISAGGQRVTGSGVAMVGTVGQAAQGSASGGSYVLTGGFHAEATAPGAPTDLIFRNGFDG